MSDATLQLSDVTLQLGDVTVQLSDVTLQLSDVTVQLSDVTLQLSDVTVQLSDVTVLSLDSPAIKQGSVKRSQQRMLGPCDHYTFNMMDFMFRIQGSSERGKLFRKLYVTVIVFSTPPSSFAC